MRLLLFEQFIQEKLLLEAKINISSTILDVLKNLVRSGSSREDWVKWSRLIVSAAESDIDYPSNEIEYLYSDSGKIFQKYRGKNQEIKLGKALQRILTSIDPKTVLGYPDFGDFLSYIEGNLVELPPDEYVLVSGDDIAKYYDTASTNLVEGTTLYKSCMKGKDPNTFNLYTKNPDVISLLVRLDGGKVSTRALVWKLDGQGDVDYFVDRIYSNDDPLTKIVGIEKFIESKFPGKKYVIKQKDENWINGVDIKLFLKNLDFNLYPYVDSFSYLYFPMKNVDMKTLQVELNPDSGFLSNDYKWRKKPRYLCFELLDHRFATRKPLNCQIKDKEKGIYHYSGDLFYLLTQDQRFQYVMKMAQNGNDINDDKFELLTPEQQIQYAMKMAENGGYISDDQFKLLNPDQKFQWAMKKAEKGGFISYEKFKLLEPDQRFQYVMKMAQNGNDINDDKFELLTPEQQIQYAMKMAENGGYISYDQFKLLELDQRFQFAMKNAQNGHYILEEQFKLLEPNQRFQYVMKMAQNGNDIPMYCFVLLTPEQVIEYKEKTKSFTKS